MAEQLTRKKLKQFKEWYSTGCTVLDLAIANKLPGGFPGGRISHVYGEKSTTKSALAIEPLGAAQRKGGLAFYDDTERALDATWLDLNGVEYDYDFFEEKPKKDSNFFYSNTETIEDLFDKEIPKVIKKMIEKGKENKCVLTVDSLTALPCKKEKEEELEAGTYGGDRAKQYGRGYRKRLSELAESGLCVVVVDQVREKMNVGYGDKFTHSGGRAIGFYSSVQIILKKIEILRDKEGTDIGVRIAFKIEKNKVGPPFRIGNFRFIWECGIDNIGTNLEFLKENKILSEEEKEAIRTKVRDLFEDKLKKAEESGRKSSMKTVEKEIKKKIKEELKKERTKGWYSFKEHKEKSLEDMIDYIEDNNLESELREEIGKLWELKYKIKERKKEKVRH